MNRRGRVLVTIGALLASLFVGAPSPTRAVADTYYVGEEIGAGGSCSAPDFGVDDHMGNAGDAIQAALDDADGGNDIVVICAGTYELDGELVVDYNVTIQGVGASQVTLTRDPEYAGRLVIVHNREVTISGLTMSGASNTDEGNGAAFLGWSGAAITVSNCVFSDNYAEYEGGAIWMDSDSTLTISNSTFTGNSSTDGGAIMMNSDTELVITGSRFTDNHAVGDIDVEDPEGGAIYAFQDLGMVLEVLEISNSTFTGNTSVEDGGAVYADYTLTIDSSSFTDNHAIGESDTTEGGAVYVNEADEVVITGSSFTANSAYEDGGAIALDDLIPEVDGVGGFTLVGNSFSWNQAKGDSGADGGAVFFSARDVELTNNRFTRNSAERSGGAVYGGAAMEGSSPYFAYLFNFARNAFTGNRSSTYGGALAVETTPVAGSIGPNAFRSNVNRRGGADLAQIGEVGACSTARSRVARAWRRSGARDVISVCLVPPPG